MIVFLISVGWFW